MSTPIDRLTALDRLMLGASRRWPQDIGALAILGELRRIATQTALRKAMARGVRTTRAPSSSAARLRSSTRSLPPPYEAGLSSDMGQLNINMGGRGRANRPYQARHTTTGQGESCAWAGPRRRPAPWPTPPR